MKTAESNRIGLTPEEVGTALSGALLGVDAGEVRLEDRSIRVRARAPDSLRFDATQLGSIPIVSSATKGVAPLGSLATFQSIDSRGELLRENQQQMISITAGVSGRSLGDVMKDVKTVIAQNRAPSGVRLELGGQYASQQESFKALMLVLALACASVIAVMVIQFESFVEPLVVLAAAPLSFVGAIGLEAVLKFV